MLMKNGDTAASTGGEALITMTSCKGMTTRTPCRREVIVKTSLTGSRDWQCGRGWENNAVNPHVAKAVTVTVIHLKGVVVDEVLRAPPRVG